MSDKGWTKERRAEAAERARQRWATGDFGSPEVCAKRNAKMATINRTPEARARVSEMSRKMWADPEMRAKMIEHNRARARRKLTPEQERERSAIMSARSRKNWDNPEMKAKISAAIRAAKRKNKPVIEVPKWVPDDLEPTYVEIARRHGEETAASRVRKLKAQRMLEAAQ